MRKLLLGLSLFIALAGSGQNARDTYYRIPANSQQFITMTPVSEGSHTMDIVWRGWTDLTTHIIAPAATSYVYPTKIAGLNALVYVSPGIDTTQQVNVLLFSPGAGEQGTDITKLYVHGPFLYLKAGVDIGVKLVVIAIQNTNANPQPNEYQTYIDGIKKIYKVNKIVLTGLSRGGQNAEWFANNSEARLAQIAGMVVFSSQGTVSDYPTIAGTLNPSLYLKYNIPIWRGVGDQDFTWPINQGLANTLSAVAPKLAIWTTWKGAGHGDPVWADGYRPGWTANATGMDIYQWSSTIMGAPPAPPVVIVITYKSIDQTATYSKACTCGTPSLVTYSVPAGKYASTVSQAAADSLATADMLANGQAYANTNGTCTPVLVTTHTITIAVDSVTKVTLAIGIMSNGSITVTQQ